MSLIRAQIVDTGFEAAEAVDALCRCAEGLAIKGSQSSPNELGFAQTRALPQPPQQPLRMFIDSRLDDPAHVIQMLARMTRSVKGPCHEPFTPVSSSLAPEAAKLRQLGMTFRAIGKALAVDEKTVRKALRR